MLSWWPEYVNNHRDKREEVIQFTIIKQSTFCKVIVGNQVMSVWILISLSVFLLPGIMSLSNIWWLCDGYRPDKRADAGPVCSGPGDAEWCQPGYICEKCSLNVRQFIWLLSDRHKSIGCNVLKPNRLLPLLRFIVNIICKSNKGKWLKWYLSLYPCLCIKSWVSARTPPFLYFLHGSVLL